jgi:hypothetical protein
MTEYNVHSLALAEFERERAAEMVREVCRTQARQLAVQLDCIGFICEAIREAAHCDGLPVYPVSPEQLITVARIYARALQGDRPPLESAADWTRQRVGVDRHLGILTLNWAGMVIAIEPDGYAHT